MCVCCAGQAQEPYLYLPYFYSRIFNLSWQFWGVISEDGKPAEVCCVLSVEPPRPRAGPLCVGGEGYSHGHKGHGEN